MWTVEEPSAESYLAEYGVGMVYENSEKLLSVKREISRNHAGILRFLWKSSDVPLQGL